MKTQSSGIKRYQAVSSGGNADEHQTKDGGG